MNILVVHEDKEFIYHILLIIRGEKVSCFSQISSQLQKFLANFATTCLNIKYFKSCRKATSNMPLSDPKGLLSKKMDTETIKRKLELLSTPERESGLLT